VEERHHRAADTDCTVTMMLDTESNTGHADGKQCEDISIHSVGCDCKECVVIIALSRSVQSEHTYSLYFFF